MFSAAIRSRTFASTATTAAASRRFLPSTAALLPSGCSASASSPAPPTNGASSAAAALLLLRPRRCLLSTKAAKPSSSSLTHLIKELRTTTGAPVIECKRALSDPDVDGDLGRAADWLRKHGSAKASSKVSGRDASEGMVGVKVSSDGKSASIVRVASETDFAGRSDAFGTLVEDVADAALGLGPSGGGGGVDHDDGPIDVDGTLLSASVVGGEGKDGTTVRDALDEAILSIRENLQITSAVRLSVASDDDSVLVGYVHGRLPGSDCAGTAAALVEIGRKTLPSGGASSSASALASSQDMIDAGKKLAMHVVAAKPQYLSPETVPAEQVEREKAVLNDQVADSGKPPYIVEKMVNGRMRKYYEGVCLTEQSHVVVEEGGGPKKVSEVLDEMGMEVLRFERTSVQ